MSPSAPVTVQPSCVQTASTAMNAASLARATRNTPAIDSTSTAPPTAANAEPATVTWTLLFANWPALLPSGDAAPPLGDVDDELHAENSVASVAHDATWQAPSQNRRREIDVSVSEIALILIGLVP